MGKGKRKRKGRTKTEKKVGKKWGVDRKGRKERKGGEGVNISFLSPVSFFERKMRKMTVKERKQEEMGKERKGQEREKKLKMTSK